MLEQDIRKVSIEVQEYLRRRTILMRQEGKPFSDIAEFLGVHRNTASDWWHAYQQQGDAALSQKKRGRRVGQARHLSAEQESLIQDFILKHTPLELEIDSALWTRRAVQILIGSQTGKTLPIRTVGEYLNRWGYTPQKPLQRAYEQDPVAVQVWLEHDYPNIQQQAKHSQAQIYWGDQSGLTSRTHRGRGYSPRGQTPQVRLSQDRSARINYIASINNQGKVRFMLYNESFTSAVMIEFLSRLIHGTQKPVFLILDRHPVHRCKAVQNWVKRQKETLQIFFLPSYSPQLNPAEYLNCDVKYGVHSKPPTQNQKQLSNRALSHLRRLQKLPTRVQSYFKQSDIAYAAT